MKILPMALTAAVLAGWSAMPAPASACTYSHNCLTPMEGYSNAYGGATAQTPNSAEMQSSGPSANGADPAIKPESGLWGPHGSQWSYE